MVWSPPSRTVTDVHTHMNGRAASATRERHTRALLEPVILAKVDLDEVLVTAPLVSALLIIDSLAAAETADSAQSRDVPLPQKATARSRC